MWGTLSTTCHSSPPRAKMPRGEITRRIGPHKRECDFLRKFDSLYCCQLILDGTMVAHQYSVAMHGLPGSGNTSTMVTTWNVSRCRRFPRALAWYRRYEGEYWIPGVSIGLLSRSLGTNELTTVKKCDILLLSFYIPPYLTTKIKSDSIPWSYCERAPPIHDSHLTALWWPSLPSCLYQGGSSVRRDIKIHITPVISRPIQRDMNPFTAHRKLHDHANIFDPKRPSLYRNLRYDANEIDMHLT